MISQPRDQDSLEDPHSQQFVEKTRQVYRDTIIPAIDAGDNEKAIYHLGALYTYLLVRCKSKPGKHLPPYAPALNVLLRDLRAGSKDTLSQDMATFQEALDKYVAR